MPRLVQQRTRQQPALDGGTRAENLAALSHDTASLLPVVVGADIIQN